MTCGRVRSGEVREARTPGGAMTWAGERRTGRWREDPEVTPRFHVWEAVVSRDKNGEVRRGSPLCG